MFGYIWKWGIKKKEHLQFFLNLSFANLPTWQKVKEDCVSSVSEASNRAILINVSKLLWSTETMAKHVWLTNYSYFSAAAPLTT